MLEGEPRTKVKMAIQQIILAGKKPTVSRVQMLVAKVPHSCIAQELQQWERHAELSRSTLRLIFTFFEELKAGFDENEEGAPMHKLAFAIASAVSGSEMATEEDLRNHLEVLNQEFAEDLLQRRLPELEARIPRFAGLIKKPDRLKKHIRLLKSQLSVNSV
jgi:predicted metal-dependent hydrolase